MKKRSNQVVFLFLFVFLSFAGCKKKTVEPVPTLPPITMVGANTMGCYVDGELWLPAAHLSLETPFNLRCQYSTQDGFYVLMSRDHPGSAYTNSDNLSIEYKPLNATGSYDLTDVNKATVYTKVEGVDQGGFIDKFTVTKGTLTITRLDINNQIISGQFSYTVKNNRTGGTHQVTDGRFDLIMNTSL